MKSHRNALQPGYRLHWYVIKKILGQGGFGITYLADDTNLQQEVAIKEFLPVEMAVRDADASVQPLSSEHGEHFRWGLDRFMSEAQTLARFKHPNIVRVNAVFPENNTAYMVMEYEHGRGMHELLKEENTLDQDKLNAIILPVLDGLERVHAAGFIHRDIKPPNIFIREDGSPVLLDFGSARQSFGVQTRTLTTMVSPGFAPFEQYVSKGDKQGPWTDIYGLGATMYRAATGKAPADAMDRSEALLHTSRDIFVTASEISPVGYSDNLLAAIDHALAFNPADRPQSITAWRQELGGHTDAPAVTGIGTRPLVDQEAETMAVRTFAQPEDQMTAVQVGEGSRTGEQGTGGGIFSARTLKWLVMIPVVILVLAILNHLPDKNHETPAVSSQEEKTATKVMDVITPVTVPETDAGVGEVQKTVDRLLSEAGQDLAALRLTSPAGNNAVEKYRAVLAIDPDNGEAHGGLDRVVEEYLHLMDTAMRNNDMDRAASYLQKALDINPDHPQVISARDRLDAERERQRQVADAQRESEPAVITGQTEQAVSENRVNDEERRTLQSLRERIRKNPQDKQARNQLKNIADSYQETVREAIKARKYTVAEAYITEILNIAPPDSKAYKDLEDLLSKVKKMRAASGD